MKEIIGFMIFVLILIGAWILHPILGILVILITIYSLIS